MDPSSIITQVPQNSHNADDEEERRDNAAAAASTPAAAAANLAAVTPRKETKKRSRRNFLCAFICCFGKKSSRRKGKEGPDGNGAAPAGGGDAPDAPGGGGRPANAVAHGGGGGGGAKGGGGGKALLPALRPEHSDRKCIVIDLDETLVHSSFKPINNADFIVPVEIDGTIHQVYVLKRPHVDEFLCRMGELFECVLFTASLSKYADPVADLLDKWDVFHSRLFRESCVFHRGNYVKDLSRLGRELPKILIVDNSPASYIFHPENAVPCASWFDDMNDRELLDLIPFLEGVSKLDSVYDALQHKFRPAATANGSNDKAAAAVVNT